MYCRQQVGRQRDLDIRTVSVEVEVYWRLRRSLSGGAVDWSDGIRVVTAARLQRDEGAVEASVVACRGGGGRGTFQPRLEQGQDLVLELLQRHARAEGVYLEQFVLDGPALVAARRHCFARRPENPERSLKQELLHCTAPNNSAAALYCAS